MQYYPIQGQGHQPFKVEIRPFSKAISAIYNVSWQLTTDSYTRAQCLHFFRPDVLVFVSRDFELGRNVSWEESTVSPIWG